MKTLFSERIRSARIMNGLSLQGLADKLENRISRQAIHKYEKGDALPDSQMMALLCNALGVRPDYFTQETAVELGEINFRKIEKLPVRNQETIIERTREFLSRYIELEELIGIVEAFQNPIESLSITSEEDVRKAANELRKKWNLFDKPIGNVVEMLEENHIKVLEMEADDEFDGLQTWIKERNIPVIVLNSTKLKSIDRKRFTALHELGHLLLPLDGISEKIAEKYCHAFAGEMLFPELAQLKELGIKRTKFSIQELGIIKQQYGISIQAIVYRAYSLNIISVSYYKYFFQYINQMGWKREEPYEFNGFEKSLRFNQLIYRALSEDLISIGKAAALMNMKVSDFRIKMMIAG